MGVVPSLRRASEFRALGSSGSRTRGCGMTVIVGRNRTGERARLGLAVRSRSAVTRNRVRRRVKEAFRAASVPEGVDVLVQASEDAAGVEFQKVVDLLERATGKLEG